MKKLITIGASIVLILSVSSYGSQHRRSASNGESEKQSMSHKIARTIARKVNAAGPLTIVPVDQQAESAQQQLVVSSVQAEQKIEQERVFTQDGFGALFDSEASLLKSFGQGSEFSLTYHEGTHRYKVMKAPKYTGMSSSTGASGFSLSTLIAEPTEEIVTERLLWGWLPYKRMSRLKVTVDAQQQKVVCEPKMVVTETFNSGCIAVFFVLAAFMAYHEYNSPTKSALTTPDLHQCNSRFHCLATSPNTGCV